jgi:chromosomal replication initiation ATPase DnaA
MKTEAKSCAKCGRVLNSLSFAAVTYWKATGQMYHVQCLPDVQPAKDAIIEKIILIIAEYKGITPDEIVMKSRQKKYQEVRQMVQYFARKHGVTLSQQKRYGIGKGYSGWNHANIMNNINKAEFFINTYRDYAVDYALAEQIVNAAFI